MKLVILVFGMMFVPACSKPSGPEAPFASGIFNIPWESTRGSVDSLVAGDSTWQYESSIVNTANGRQIVVLKRDGREYYLEFDADGKLYLVNYISDHTDLDTLTARLTRHYGSPTISDTSAQSPFERRLWHDERQSNGLDFELLVTRKSYSFMAKRKR